MIQKIASGESAEIMFNPSHHDASLKAVEPLDSGCKIRFEYFVLPFCGPCVHEHMKSCNLSFNMQAVVMFGPAPLSCVTFFEKFQNVLLEEQANLDIVRDEASH